MCSHFTAPEPGNPEADGEAGGAGDQREAGGGHEEAGGPGAEAEGSGGGGKTQVPVHGGEGAGAAGVRARASSQRSHQRQCGS